MDINNDDPFAEDEKLPPFAPLEAYNDELNGEITEEEIIASALRANELNTIPLPEDYIIRSVKLARMNGHAHESLDDQDDLEKKQLEDDLSKWDDDEDFPDEFRNPTKYPDQSRYNRKDTIAEIARSELENGGPVVEDKLVDKWHDDVEEISSENTAKEKKHTHKSTTETLDLVEEYAFCAKRSRQVIRIKAENYEADGRTFDNFKKEIKAAAKQRSEICELWLQNCTRVEDVMLHPKMDRPIFTRKGRNYINLYTPPAHDMSGGDISVWLSYMEHLIPDAKSRVWFEQWLAYKFTHPEHTGVGVVMVANGVFGTGRGTLSTILKRLFGSIYVQDIEHEILAGSTYQSQYNEYQCSALIVCVGESKDTGGSGSWKSGKEFYERLKSLIDPMPGREVHISRKGLPNGHMPTFCSYFIATNHYDALRIPRDDRRLSVIENGAAMNQEQSSIIWEWLVNPKNIGALAKHLQKVDMTGYNPFMPMDTEAKREMAEAAISDTDRAVEAVINRMRGETFTAQQVINHINDLKIEHDWYLPEGWENIVRRKILTAKYFRVGKRHGDNWFVLINDIRTPVYTKSRALKSKWDHSEVLFQETKKSDNLGAENQK